jgi:HSP20 family protein
MKLVKRSDYWDPFNELTRLQDEMNELFDVTYAGFPAGPHGLLDRAWVPAVDISESKDDFRIKVDLPGVRKEDINITVENNMCVIKGDKKQDSNINDKNHVRSERFFGVFNRSIALPSLVDTSKVSAEYVNGTLEITLPKREEAKPKQISINVK